MKRILLLTISCMLSSFSFAEGKYVVEGIIKIGGETLVKGGEAVVEGAMRDFTKGAQSWLSAGMRSGVVKQMDIALPNPSLQANLMRSVQASLPKAIAPWSQNLAFTVLAAQKANQTLFNIAPRQSTFAMDSYPSELLTKYKEIARISTTLPLPLSMEERDLLVAADTEHKFFDIDFDLEDGYVVASYRQPIHLNVNPGSFMYDTRVGGIVKLENAQYQALQRAVQNQSEKDIANLKYRAGISYYHGGRKYLNYDEFRGFVSTGDTEFFGEPFLALIDRPKMANSVGVFFRVKKNLLVRKNFVFYSLPANSYVCMDTFNGAIDRASFLFDARPLMSGFNRRMTTTLQRTLSNMEGAAQREVRILTTSDVPVQKP